MLVMISLIYQSLTNYRYSSYFIIRIVLSGVNRTALREIKLLQELSHRNIIGVSSLFYHMVLDEARGLSHRAWRSRDDSDAHSP